MIVLVCGGRDFDDIDFLEKTTSKTGVCINCGNVRIIKKKETWYCYEGQRKVWKKSRVNRKKPHGLTTKEAKEFLFGKCCFICKRTENLNVDHCHKTNEIRGVLCTRCNLGIGYFKDDPMLLKKAIKYLVE